MKKPVFNDNIKRPAMFFQNGEPSNSEHCSKTQRQDFRIRIFYPNANVEWLWGYCDTLNFGPDHTANYSFKNKPCWLRRKRHNTRTKAIAAAHRYDNVQGFLEPMEFLGYL